jgi:hypothetical protein
LNKAITLLTLLLLLLLSKHLSSLLRLEMGEGVWTRPDTWLHASHHRATLSDGAIRTRGSWMHLHLHSGLTRTWPHGVTVWHSLSVHCRMVGISGGHHRAEACAVGGDGYL